MVTIISLIGIFLLQNVRAISWYPETEFDTVTTHMDESVTVPFTVFINQTENSNFTIEAISNAEIATVNSIIRESVGGKCWNGTLNVTGVFLGSAKVTLELIQTGVGKESKELLTVIIVRKEQIIDTIFTVSVVTLVSILFINFGCALDQDVCSKVLRKPIGPAIGFVCQFGFMPLASYFLGYLLFPDSPALQLGLFFTGISPSGGASNIWTLLLGGNLNLSITMTTICTLAAFGMMPFWIFTLGRHIFERAHFRVPYSKIGMFALGLIVPLAIGYFIQKKLPKLSRIMIRAMKPFAIVLLCFIIIFAAVTNAYLFKLFSLEILIAGMGLPWLGFLFGLTVSSIFKQSLSDVKAIAIETGIQNTSVAIFLLRITLTSPANDLTTVVPVSAAIMTPLPLIILYAIKLILDKRKTYSPNAIIPLDKCEESGQSSVICKSHSSKPLIRVLQ